MDDPQNQEQTPQNQEQTRMIPESKVRELVETAVARSRSIPLRAVPQELVVASVMASLSVEEEARKGFTKAGVSPENQEKLFSFAKEHGQKAAEAFQQVFKAK